MKKDLKTPSQTKLRPEIYLRFSLNDLILSGIYVVLSKRETCTFERLVSECFLNFPKAFSFKRYPKWPDALKFDRPLRALREKGLIVGSHRGSFPLNKYGESEAKDILRALTKGRLPQSAGSSRPPVRSSDDRIIEYIKNSTSFSRYLKNPKRFSISDQEFRNLLRCTLETPDRVIKQNLEYYLKIAEQYKETEIKRFLIFCKKKIQGGLLWQRNFQLISELLRYWPGRL